MYVKLPLGRHNLSFLEETPIHSASHNSTSIASANLLVQAYNCAYGLPVTIFRYNKNNSPFLSLEKVIRLMINNAREDTLLSVYIEGLNILNWPNVLDF